MNCLYLRSSSFQREAEVGGSNPPIGLILLFFPFFSKDFLVQMFCRFIFFPIEDANANIIYLRFTNMTIPFWTWDYSSLKEDFVDVLKLWKKNRKFFFIDFQNFFRVLISIIFYY